MILETSWEVCNKMGGIYTVLSSRAKVMMAEHEGEVVFVGPLLSGEGEALPKDFVLGEPEALKTWSDVHRKALGLRTKVGYWNVPGQPAVVLVDFAPLWGERGDLYFKMWSAYGLESDKGYGDYDESCLFSVAATRVMHSILDSLPRGRRKHVAIFNEWQTGMGVLYSKLVRPSLHTLFITHATTVGRSIAGNGKQLYAYMEHYNGDQMAYELNVEAKHGVEKRAAHASDVFATVSRLTARECVQLLEREPVVLPNGFEPSFVPETKPKFDKARRMARERLAKVAQSLLGKPLEQEKAFFVSLSGRYEYRNKGIDLFVEVVAELRRTYQGRKEIVAFLLVPAWVAEPRGDLAYLLDHPDANGGKPLQHPTLTHWLHNMNDDAAESHFRYLGLDHAEGKVNIIFVPVYLDGRDGIFDLSYYDLLIGMDQTIYPSYYEPWGYTPMESVAFGVPTVTTNFAGFGLWAEDELGGEVRSHGATPVRLVERTDHNGEEVVRSIAEQVIAQATGKLGTAAALRKQAREFASLGEWKLFYKHYLKAYALMGKEQRQ